MQTFRRAPLSRRLIALFALAAAIAGVTIARPQSTPGPPMRDFEAYYAAGAVWNAGGDPYSLQIWNVERKLDTAAAGKFEPLPFVGPPASLPLLSAVARLPFGTANVIWRGALLAAIALLVLAALELAGRRVTIASFVLAGIAALGFGPLTSGFALGQLALPAFAFAALSLKRPWLILPAWLQPNVALAAISAPKVIVWSLPFAAFCAAQPGRDGLLHYSDVVRAHGRAEQFAIIQLTPASIAYGFGASAAVAAVVGGVVAALAVAVWLSRVLPMQDPSMRFCATCSLLPFAAPFFHEHDLVVTFVPAVVLAIRARGTASSWILAASLLCAVDWLGLAQRPQALPQALLLAAAFAAAAIALRDEFSRRSMVVSGVTLLLIAGAGIVAMHHPAPIWPDAMRAVAQNASAGTIAGAWHAELAATGLLTPDASWAALRSASLLGCAGLATVALYVDVHHVVELRDRVGMEVL